MKTETKAQVSKTTLRVASYLDSQTLQTFDNWRKSQGLGRAEGLKRIIKTSLSLKDGSDESALNGVIERLTEQVERLKRILNEA